MAEDNMEISYDDHGDDDIDINIDIDQENQDDDYMIEDAHSDAGTNDDVMVDEDNTSFAMDDDDYMPDHTVEDLQPEVVEVTEIEMTKAADIDTTVDNPFASSALPEEVQVAQRQEIVQADEPHDTSDAVQEELNMPEEPTLPVTTPGSANDTAEEVPASPKKDLKSAEVVNTDITPPSPPKSVQHDLVEEKTEETGLQPAVKQEIKSEERTIVVQWAGGDYPLVATSEFDDPDTYFLKDSSSISEPLHVFFFCVRDALGEEVGSQDELTLTIEDLGLETFESSLSNNDVTLAQLVDLHTTLCRNDGQTELSPFYITLNTKPDFGRSFRKLNEDAKSGTGLNQVMEWHGEDEAALWGGSEFGVGDESSGGDDDDYEEDEHYEETHVAHGEPQGENEGQVDEHQDEQPAIAAEEVVPEHAVEHSEGEAEPAAMGDDQDQAGEKHGAHEHAPQELERAAEQDTTPKMETAKSEEKVNNDHDDEGDLIDYEDDDYAPAMIQSKAASRRASKSEEDLSSPCLRPASCFCSSCSKRLLAEYEAINEKLEHSRRSSRSSSQTVEGSNGEASAKPATEETGNAKPTNDHTEQTTSEFADITEPDQEEVHNEEYQDEAGQPENEQDGFEEVDGTAHAQGEDEQHLNEDYTNYEEEPSENQPVEEENGETEETAQADDATEQAEETAYATDGPEQPQETAAPKDEDEISYEDDDEAPEANNAPFVAEEVEQPANVEITLVPEVNEDEIDYDDDDRAEAHPVESETVATIAQIASAKRPHDEPDALDLTGQDAKRARA